MIITATFTDADGSPALGLSPVISGLTVGGSSVFSDEPMTEVGLGFYSYNFTDYDYLEDYCFVAYDSTADQFVYITNDVDSQRNQGVIKQILGLVQGNMKVSNQTYDGSGNLLTASIYTYENSTDANLDQNRLHSYAITATYTGGRLTGYKSVEI